MAGGSQSEQRTENAIATIWLKYDEHSKQLKATDSTQKVLEYRVSQLEAAQKEHTAQMAALRADLLASISSGDSSILANLRTYDEKVQSVINQNMRTEGALSFMRWAVGIAISLLGLLVALNLLNGPSNARAKESAAWSSPQQPRESRMGLAMVRASPPGGVPLQPNRHASAATFLPVSGRGLWDSSNSPDLDDLLR